MSATGEKYIYATKRGLVVQVPGKRGKVRTRRVKTMAEGRRVRAALLDGLKVIPRQRPKPIKLELPLTLVTPRGNPRQLELPLHDKPTTLVWYNVHTTVKGDWP